jgi:hypothetical protein
VGPRGVRPPRTSCGRLAPSSRPLSRHALMSWRVCRWVVLALEHVYGESGRPVTGRPGRPGRHRRGRPTRRHAAIGAGRPVHRGQPAQRRHRHPDARAPVKRTRIDELLLLCRYHHACVHEGRWAPWTTPTTRNADPPTTRAEDPPDTS